MKSYYYILLSILLVGCASLPEHPTKSQQFPPIVPDYTGVTIPVGIAPLNFYVDEDDVEVTDVVVQGSKGEVLHANGADASFSLDEWHQLVLQNRGDSLMVTVTVRKGGEWTEYRPFPIYVSNDSLGEWGVTYRLIPPGYETYGVMGLYQRNLSNFEEFPILENRLVGGDCMNCHTSNRTDPTQFTFHVRGDNGATVVAHNGLLDILAARNGDLGGSLVYPYWHPSGQYIAYSTNQTHQNFHQLRDRRVEVYDDKSDIVLYRPETHEILLDSVIATADHLENFPSFSPDGRHLYFCACSRVDSIWKNYQQVKYNICRISFDPLTGRVGTTADTLINARLLGKSANMPRISYDGKFLLYTLSDYGCFPIWHPESDLWMLNLDTGEQFPLEAANSDDADSFHNWSQNSRWIVFTSRRDDSLYTQLYIAHINSDGRASKPFRLPQLNPREYDLETMFSFNTPDFATKPLDHQEAELTRRLLGAERQPTSLSRE